MPPIACIKSPTRPATRLLYARPHGQPHQGRSVRCGQRLTKAGTPISTGRNVYAYDQAGHLIGEYDNAGGLISEVVYLGDMPVRVVDRLIFNYHVQSLV